MGWLDIADLANVAVRRVFGFKVSYVGRSKTVEFNAPFDALYASDTIVDNMVVSAQSPVIDIMTADLAGIEPRIGDTLEIEGYGWYEVIDVQDSGRRFVKLFLVKKV